MNLRTKSKIKYKPKSSLHNGTKTKTTFDNKWKIIINSVIITTNWISVPRILKGVFYSKTKKKAEHEQQNWKRLGNDFMKYSRKQEKTIICVKSKTQNSNWISVESEKWFSSLAMTAKIKLLHSIVLVK